MHILALLLLSALASALGAAPDISQYDIAWNTSTAGSPNTDSMPTGNGRITAIVWGEPTLGGLSAYVRSPMALHLDSQVFTIAQLSIAVSPNPCASPSSTAWLQQLHLADGSISVTCTDADLSITLTLLVDATADAIVLTASGSAPFNINASLTSVRSPQRFTYKLDFQCYTSSSGPDTVLPASLPSPAPPASIGLYHVNSAAAGDVSLFNASMHQQNLAPLLGQFSDPLEGRIFGAALAGAAGASGQGAPLVRASPTTLTSAAPASAFALLLAVAVEPAAGGDEGAYLGRLAAALAAPAAPAARQAAAAACKFAVATLPCGGALAARQRLTLDPATQAITLPSGQCFGTAQRAYVDAVPCSSQAPGTSWVLTPCTAPNCGAGEMWVQSKVGGAAVDSVLGLNGAQCPWLFTWSIDSPTGVEKNELWAWNASDSTLRALCDRCPGTCVTAPAPVAEGEGAGGPAPVAAATPASALVLARQYALSRFIYAVQGRGGSGAGGGVNVPIPFNGMLFTSQPGRNGPADVDYRQWGPNHWFQNTRFPYQTFLAAGDWQEMQVVLEWVSGFIPLARARSALLLPEGQSGIFFTETVDVHGLYQGGEYGCDSASNRPPGYPQWLEGPGSEGGWVRYDFGGNGFAEAGLMALDYYWVTQDLANSQRYIPFATNYVDFYASHYTNRSADGRLLLWPTQVLETLWCEWPGFDNCCENDTPNVAAVTALVTGLLQLPEASGLLTPAQRTAYTALAAILPLPALDADNATYAMAAVESSGGHNSEGPWLYATHPFRLNTVGAQLAKGTNISTAIATWYKQGWMRENQGWSYGVLNAALLGLRSETFAMLNDRAVQPPPSGYRFPAFAQHYQDYTVSADHYAVMNTGIHLSLLQSGEDGAAGTLVLLPAWPCQVSVSFKLWGALNTSVEVVYVGAPVGNGTATLVVTPPERAAAVRWAGCVSA